VSKLTFLIILSPIILLSQIDRSSIELKALRESDNYVKPYRILKTTISDKSFFQIKYLDSDMTLDYVLRYYFYTAIDLNSNTNQLISLDGTRFNLVSKNATDITNELILLVSKMYTGKKEFESFKKIKE
tara:strand:- start:320 stop:706 length:387 start_codon:yes stop_codon:yes gene_type:complete